MSTAALERETIDLLTSQDAGELLRLAVTGSAPAAPAGRHAAPSQGETIADWTTEVDSVHHRPGAGVSVGYKVSYAVAGAEVNEYLVASTAEVPDAPGVAVLQDGVRTLRVWRRAQDPVLPGLERALDPATVGQWLAEAGVGDGAPARVQLLSYRPTRRAVIRATTAERATYLKVLPEKRARRLERRHRLLTDAAGGAPAVLARPLPTVLVLAAAAGRPLAEAIAGARSHPGDLPGPLDVAAWLDALPAEVLDLGARSSWVDRIDFHADAARGVLPEENVRIEAVEHGVRDLLDSRPVPPTVPTHGDFYEANIFTSDGQVSAVIDLDSLGPGVREDDLATLLGHLAVLRELAPRVYPHVDELVDSWFTRLAATCDPPSLAARTAGVVLSLVAGTDHDQAVARLRTAEDWLQRAVRLAAESTAPVAGSPLTERPQPHPQRREER